MTSSVKKILSILCFWLPGRAGRSRADALGTTFFRTLRAFEDVCTRFAVLAHGKNCGVLASASRVERELQDGPPSKSADPQGIAQPG